MSFDNNKVSLITRSIFNTLILIQKEKEFSTEEAFKGEAANAAKALAIKNE